MQCQYDPKVMAGLPIGMFHCPDCGEMVLAGMDHPDYDNLEESANKYFDGQYEKFKKYVKANLSDSEYNIFFEVVEENQNIKSVLFEIWLRAEPTLRDINPF
jgi:hypothetical protein